MHTVHVGPFESALHKRTPRSLIVLFSTILLVVAAIFFAHRPLIAAPSAQTNLPDFDFDAQTVISVTVAITGGQVIIVPVHLDFSIENRNGAAEVMIIPEVEQQPGMFIGVSPAPLVDAALQLPQVPGAEPDDESSGSVASGEGTHVANRNSNRRAGPGTNFQIVGRVPSGGAVTVVGANNDGTWLELDDGSWVAAFLLDPIPNSGNEADDDNADENAEDEEDEEASNAEDLAEDAAEDADVDDEAAEDALLLTTSGELAVYLGDLAAIGTQAMSTVNILNNLMAEAAPLDVAWRNEIATELGLLSNALDQYLALTPVAGYEDLHSQVTEVALSCEQAVDYLANGLNNPFALDAAVASQSVQACSSQATALAAEVQALQ